MHYADVDLGLASLGTSRGEFFVMDFPAVRLNAHALYVILAYVGVYVTFSRCDAIPLTIDTVLASLSSPAKTLLNMHDGRYIHRSRHFY